MKSLILIISILSFVFYKAETSGHPQKSKQLLLQYTAPDFIPWQQQLIDGQTEEQEPVVTVNSFPIIRNGSLLEVIYRQPGSDSIFRFYGRSTPFAASPESRWSIQKEDYDTLMLAKKN